MYKYFERDDILRRSVTVIEVGAGPVQPLAREFGEMFLKNDKYRCALIRINPIKERSSQYNDERDKFQNLVNKHAVENSGLISAK
jgi:hypothetical protein